jgi:hypothetical protein
MTTNQASLYKELDKASKNAKKVIYSASHSIEKSVQELCDMGKAEVLELIGKPGSGKEYTYSYGRHIASAEGDPPAARIGGPLYKSIVSEVTEKKASGDKGRVIGHFGSRQKYALFLEYGWRRKDGGTGAPRPFMRPTAESIRQKTPGVVARNWISYRNAAIKKLPKSSNTGADAATYVGKMR